MDPPYIMAKPFKILELLNSEELAELEAFAREPGRTGEECHAWLTARGFVLSLSAVYGWLADFREKLQVERFSGASQLAKAIMGAAQGSGVAINDAAITQIGQMIFTMAGNLSAGGELGVDDLNKLSLAMQRLALAKARTEDTRAEMRKQQQAAVEEAEKVGQQTGDVKMTCQKFREILKL
jgi:hypothetical protein